MSTIKVDTVQSTGGGAVTLTNQHAAKAWARSGGSAINESFNTSSFTDNGTGDYTISFSNAFNTSTFAGTTTGIGTAARSVNYSNALTTSIDLDAFASTTGSRVDNATGFDIHGDLA